MTSDNRADHIGSAPPAGSDIDLPHAAESPRGAVGSSPGSEWADPSSVPAEQSERTDPTLTMPGPWPAAPPWPPQGQAGPPPSPRTGLARILVIGLVAGLLGGLLGGVVGYSLARGGDGSVGVLGSPIPELDGATPLGPVEAVAQRVLPSVVQLRVTSGESRSEGSGMVLSADGLVLTNNHVVDAAATGGRVTAVFQDGTTAPADIVGRDPSSDVAVIRVTGVSGLTPIELGNSDAVRVGQQVVAIGSPLGLGGSVTSGIISATDRAVNVGQQNGASDSTVLNALQTDAAINPGNSGGPLVDMQGRVVGINSAIATFGGSSESGNIGVGFSIPINAARRVAQELQATGQATRAVLGVNVGAGGDSTGAVIGQVVAGGPAEVAGLKAGEVITRVDERVITNGDELVAAIRDHVPNDQVKLVVNGREVVVTLGSTSG